MKPTTKRGTRSGSHVLDRATTNLLRVLKQEMGQKEEHLDYGKLRNDGYTERLLARMEEA